MDGYDDAQRLRNQQRDADTAASQADRPDEPRDDVARSLTALTLEGAACHHRLAVAVRTYVENATEIGTDPAEIRATALGCLIALDPNDPEVVADITAFMSATLDEALGPQGEGV